MAYFNEKPNGGALSIEAHLGKKVIHPIKHLKPNPQTLTQDLDQPAPEHTDKAITRAYLVELRVGFQTRIKTSTQAPYLYCIYATEACQRFFERRCPIDYGEAGFQIPEDIDTTTHTTPTEVRA